LGESWVAWSVLLAHGFPFQRGSSLLLGVVLMAMSESGVSKKKKRSRFCVVLRVGSQCDRTDCCASKVIVLLS